MKIVLSILFLLLFAFTLEGQTRLEVEGEAKITILRNTKTSDENIVRKADGNLAIRKYVVGDFVQGGVVFWVDESGEHGLVCAKQDQSSAIRWHAGFYGNTRAKGDGPYSGEMNTAIIIAAHVSIGDDNNTNAARWCSELKITEGGKTYGDWYLPSKEELELIYLNKSTINSSAQTHGGSGTQEGIYWSSTENIDNSAYGFDFRTNSQTSGEAISILKYETFRLRAIRAF